MHRWTWILTLLLCLAFASAAAAQIGPTGTRISVDGLAPRPVQIYGHPDGREFYAPLAQDLRRFGLQFQPAEEALRVLGPGRVLATWPVVRDREEIDLDADPPQVLHLGGAYHLPVNAVRALVGAELEWDAETNLLGLRRGRNPAVGAVAASGPVRLGAPSLQLEEDALQLRVEASGPVQATTFRLTSPARVVFDFHNAVWEDDVTAPAPLAPALASRIGQFEPTVARFVLEVSGPDIRCLALPLEPTEEIVARVGTGTVIAGLHELPPLPGLGGGRQVGIRRRPALASRGELLRQPLEALPDAALFGRIIAVDAGHGGHNAGARGPTGLQEKDINLAIALDLAELLQQAGATVILPRIDDTFVPLDERAAFANFFNADLFISIHCNAAPRSGNASGTETYYHSPLSLGLAQAIHTEVVRVVGDRDRGVKRAAFAVIRQAAMPAVLVEAAFIDHPRNETLLADPASRRKIAAGIFAGVIRYYGGG